jgi:GNAT superfamily N-acetyltransferase
MPGSIAQPRPGHTCGVATVAPNPMDLRYTTVRNSREVEQILALQALNHRDTVDAETAAREGFTSVRHDPAVLQAMNRTHPSAVAWSGEQLAGYCLMMPREFRDRVPILDPMFALLDGLSWRGEPLATNPRWFVMGQVCVAKDFRGQGVFDRLYQALREAWSGEYDFTVTEISQQNPRSLRAHRRVGFQTLQVYPDPVTGERWEVVVWDWR